MTDIAHISETYIEKPLVLKPTLKIIELLLKLLPSKKTCPTSPVTDFDKYFFGL